MISQKYSIAIDFGTTNIDAVLLDLENKSEVRRNTISNSQNKISPDIITRIFYAIENNAYNEIQKTAYEDLNNIIGLLVKKSSIDYSNIGEILVISNPAMMHFLLGMNVEGLSKFPYESKITGTETLEAVSINNKLINAKIKFLPIISGYIGSDFISAVISTRLIEKKEKKILVDLGTNAEIAIWNGEDLYCTSAAAGPAFGYKGSEVISNIATMLKFHLISNTGAIVDHRYKGIISPIMIRSLQLAKSAVKSAIEVLLKEANISEKDLKEIYIAGVFGELIHPWSAMFIGMIPSIDIGKIRSVGNAALNGAKKILLGNAGEDKINELITKSKLVFLNDIVDFQDMYVKNINF